MKDQRHRGDAVVARALPGAIIIDQARWRRDSLGLIETRRPIVNYSAKAYSRSTDPLDIAVGARMRARRLELGISQSELASVLGVSFQ